MGKRMKLFVIIAGGCWMLGEGARMVIMALFHQGWYYQPNTFDLFFDWIPLTILGSLIFYEGVRSFYLDQKSGQRRSDEGPLIAVKKEHKSRTRASRFLK
jgi:hypothetical protein